MKFWKYHGTGNDFIIVDGINESLRIDPEKVVHGCKRRFGIGADGFLYLLPGMKGADVSMRIINSDGSEAEMCGNGIRCLAKHVSDFGIVKKDVFSINTLAGNKDVSVERGSTGKVSDVTVGLGAPSLETDAVPMTYDGGPRFINQPISFGEKEIRGTALSMGNPHFVTFSKLSNEERRGLGPVIGSDPRFPQKVNVGFAAINDKAIDLCVYERGAGWTMACGTGAGAAATAACVSGLLPYDTPIAVNLLGGTLTITVAKDLSSVTMKGPAVLVYEGIWRR
ncbi:MAG: diaminopimelate epimerase [Thermoplasmatales archaeon]|jgi:diaminopimelate epimerase|nr:diaminopimelate epimerase [Thermoplasmatales archaeon]